MTRVVLLAALVGEPACDRDPKITVDVNYLGSRNVIEACRYYGVPRMVFASTDSCYGIQEGILFEDSPLNPISLYAELKRDMERELLQSSGNGFRADHSSPGHGVRTFPPHEVRSDHQYPDHARRGQGPDQDLRREAMASPGSCGRRGRALSIAWKRPRTKSGARCSTSVPTIRITRSGLWVSWSGRPCQTWPSIRGTAAGPAGLPRQFRQGRKSDGVQDGVDRGRRNPGDRGCPAFRALTRSRKFNLPDA